MGAWISGPLADDPPPDIEAVHQRRLAATYVDIASDGTIAVPDQAIVMEDLDDLLGEVRSEVEFCEAVLRGATTAQLAAIFAETRNSAVVRQFREAQRSPIGPMALAIAMRRGLDPSTALEFVAAVEDLVSGDPPRSGGAEDQQANE